MTLSAYPANLDVFLTLVDGFHPVTADDQNLLLEALERVEQAMGWGPTDGPTYGPKGGNADVRQRLDTFLEDYGGLKDVAFVTGTCRLGQLADSEPQGLFVSFGKSLSSQNYTVLWTCMQPEKDGDNWSLATPAIAWIAHNGRTANGVFFYAVLADGTRINPTDDRTATFAVLAFGPGATY